MQKVMISGHLGFLAGSLTEYLLKTYDYEIIGFDARTYAANLELDYYLNNQYFEKLTCYCGPQYKIQKYKKLKEICELHKPDVFLNFAAETHVDNSIQNSKEFIKTNVNGVHSVLEVCKDLKIPLIHVSTDETLDHSINPQKDGANYFLEDDYHDNWGFSQNYWFYRLKEDARLNPQNPYSASKAAGEHLINAYKNTYGIKATIVRPTNIYGPRQYKEKFIPTIISSALHNKQIPVYGKGENWRDYLYIDDFIRAFDLILHEGTHDIYHIAANQERQNINTVKEILKQMGKPESLIEFVKNRPGHDFSYSLDCSRLKTEFNWEPQVSFEEGISHTIKYYEGSLNEEVSTLP